MENSQYWSSLWGLGLILVLVFVCVSLGIWIFVFLFDRISIFEIWNSPVWLKLKIPVIVLGIISFVVAALALSRYSGRKELKTIQDYAQAQGWDFSRNAPADIKTGIEEILSDYEVNSYFVRTVETGRRNLYLFKCAYKHKDSTSTRINTRYGTACLVQSDRFRSAAVPVNILTRDWTEVMIPDKIDMGESPFTQEFIVISKDPLSAKKVVNESLQFIMLEHIKRPFYNPVGVMIGPRGAVVLTEDTTEPERLQDLIEIARKIEAAAK